MLDGDRYPWWRVAFLGYVRVPTPDLGPHITGGTHFMTNYSAPQPAAGTGEDPGKTLGIVGLVLAIVLPLIGLIVSIIARKKSREAGFDNGLAKAGIIVGIILLVLGIIGTIASVALGFAAVDAGVSTY